MEFSHLNFLPLADVPEFSADRFCAFVADKINSKARLAAFFGVPAGAGRARLHAVLAIPNAGLCAARSEALGEFMSLTPSCPQAHWFERDIHESLGVTPLGHPWLKPIRFTGAHGSRPKPGVTDYFQVKGPEIHEVAVGPVHAGIIEPGHFRFQCYGENVLHLEISLGYQHRGVEQAILTGPRPRRMHLFETLAGDTSIGHAYAHCSLLETLGGYAAPPRGLALRRLALELERLANHTGDLGALAGDVGFLPTMSYCGRIRGDFLNMTALICGNRFGRGLVRPGGAGYDLDSGLCEELAKRLLAAKRDVFGALELLFNSSSVLNRFENTGLLTPQNVLDLGLVGPPARACGVMRDARRNRAAAGCEPLDIVPKLHDVGDVFGRAMVRKLEIEASLEFCLASLDKLAEGPLRAAALKPAPESLAIAFIEGWRGEICHVGLTDKDGEFSCYKVFDPSYRNWFALALALRGEQISDFPLCNKSFNLSYCGHDL